LQGSGPAGVFSFLHDQAKTFAEIVVHPSQEMLRHPAGAFFRGGPEWPHFKTQIYARHCWRRLPTPVDSRPHPSAQPVETVDRGVWCGPISQHFGHMVADFGMRIAGSGMLDETTPLVFSIREQGEAEPPPFFWQIIDHLAIDRRRVLLVRKPTRFGRLSVLPQAERRFGGGPSRRHLRLMDAITAPPFPAEQDLGTVFVSRARLPKGRFAGESYLDEVLTAAGVTVFHPESADLHAQFRLYRRARRLIFSEGSALHALQLLGRVEAEVVILARRPWARMTAVSLGPRVRSMRHIRAAGGFIYGLLPSGDRQHPAGISLFDEKRCVSGLRALGIDIAPFWDPRVYAERRDGDIAAWIGNRLAFATHPGERRTIERHLRRLSLRHLMPASSVLEIS
jgi:hypothetical protein